VLIFFDFYFFLASIFIIIYLIYLHFSIIRVNNLFIISYFFIKLIFNYFL